MPALSFYSDPQYRQKQSELTKANWQKGIYNFFYKRIKKICVRKGCQNVFYIQPHEKKKFCSQSCSALVNNPQRITSEITKVKISNALKGKPNPYRGIEKVPRIPAICSNPVCKKQFQFERWKRRKYCSSSCAIKNIGSKSTSPKAARGKSGIRPDINPSVCFYSRWEANFARILNYLGIRWEFGRKSFDLKTQTYRPDFYLPDLNIYLEVKNFLGQYSDRRNKLFKKLYPEETLILILKEDYKRLEKAYSQLIPNWEFS